MARSPVIVASHVIGHSSGWPPMRCSQWAHMGSPARSCGNRADSPGSSPPRWCSGRLQRIGMELLGSVGAIGTYPILVWSVVVAGIGMAAGGSAGPARSNPGTRVTRPSAGTPSISLALVLVAALIYAIPSLLGPSRLSATARSITSISRRVGGRPGGSSWWRPRSARVSSATSRRSATSGSPGCSRVGRRPWRRSARPRSCSWPARRRMDRPGCSGAGRSASLIAACWFVTCTPLLLYSFEPNVDTIFVAGYLRRPFLPPERAGPTGERRRSSWGLGGRWGPGTKAIGVVFVPPLLALGSPGW